MKLNKIWVAASMMLALCSCTNEPAKDASWKKMDYPVALSLEGKGALRATQTGSELSASYLYERAVENLTVVVFTHNNVNNTPIAVEKVITLDKNQLPADPYKEATTFDMGMAGTFQFEVIANGYKDASDKETFVRKFRQGMSYEEFKNVVFDRPLPKHGETGFAMLSTEPAKVTTQKGNRVDVPQKIKLRRLACRIDLFNKLPDEIKITKVTLKNQMNKSFMLPQNVFPDNSDGGAISYTKQDGNWFTETVISGGIYSYENPLGMDEYYGGGATTLLLEGTYNNTPWRKEIEFKKKDGKEYIPLLRNHLYRVHLTKGNGTTPGDDGKDDPANADKINYVIEVLDWDEDAAIDYSDSNVMNAESTNPLAFMAESDVNPAGNGFVTDYSSFKNVGFFDMYNACSKRFNPIQLDGELYHVPSFEEIKSIFPASFSDFSLVSEQSIIQNVIVGGERVKCEQVFKTNNVDVIYALRFIGTKYQSAWKYAAKKIDDGGGNYSFDLEITSRNVDNGVTVSQIASEDFWRQHKGNDVVRIFHRIGYYDIKITEFLNTANDGYSYSNASRFIRDTGGGASIPLCLKADNGIGFTHNPMTGSVSIYRTPLRLFKGGVKQSTTSYEVSDSDSSVSVPEGGGKKKIDLIYYFNTYMDYSGVSGNGVFPYRALVYVLSKDYEVTVKEGDEKQLIITPHNTVYDDTATTITVKPGPAATFVLRVTPKLEPDRAQEVVIHRRG